MGANGSTLESDKQNGSNLQGTDSAHGSSTNISCQSDVSARGNSKNSLKRQKHKGKQHNLQIEHNASDDPLYRLGNANAVTTSQSSTDFIAAAATTTTTTTSSFGVGAGTGGDFSNFGSFLPKMPTRTESAKSNNNYTPFPTSQLSSLPQTHHHHKQPSAVTKVDLGVDANTMVVLQDFEAGESHNLISLRQGDALHFVSTDRNRGTCEVRLLESLPEGAPASFLIPQHVAMLCRSLDAFPWYHGRVSRVEAERLLSSGIDGTFLVRESESSVGQLSVSLRSGQRVHHYRLTTDVGTWFLTPEWKFRTVPHLVRHHSRHPDGLACQLLYPAPRVSQSPQPMSTPTSEFRELDRIDFKVERLLGGGQYGEVHEATWLSRGRKVAIKTLRLHCAMNEREFLQEARVMAALRHPNLVKLLGVVTRERPFYIVTEFMAFGNLQDFLRSNQPRIDCANPIPVIPVLIRFAVDIASAMHYLEAKHFIHRDLAARNCLVSEDSVEPGFVNSGKTDRLVVKVGDFGLARLVAGARQSGPDAAYTANATGQFPIKWTAPEGLAYQRFSTKSDIWAFGILLWEIVTYGASPYPSVELSAVYGLLERGYRMEQPADCPSDIYQIMRDCWRWEPLERPSFYDIRSKLQSILDKNDVKLYEPMETSTFEAEPRGRSSSMNSPSPSNIARCRPHNFSFRPQKQAPPDSQVLPAPVAAAPTARSCVDELHGEFVLRRGSTDNNNNNKELLVTPNRGYGASNATKPVQKSPPMDLSSRVTAELAEQMRRRRALADGEQRRNSPLIQHRHSMMDSNNEVKVDKGANESSKQPLVSGDGRPVAPVKPVFRKVQQSSNEYTHPVANSNGHRQAVLLRSASPSTLPSQANNRNSNVNWTWDDVHRLCQSLVASLTEDVSSMSMSSVGRITPPAMASDLLSSTPNAIPVLLDLAAALDSLADSLPPRSRFQVRQLEHAIRTATSSSAGAATTPISSAQIDAVLSLIPPPSALTTESPGE